MSTAAVNGTPRRRFRGSFRCPVCGGAEDDPRGEGRRCCGWLSDDGWAHCSREEHAGQCRPDPNAATWAHKIGGKCNCGQEHAPAPDEPKTVRRKSTLDKVYDYTDAAGELLFQAVRFKSPKGFAQRRPDGNGGWAWTIKGLTPVLYRLPELLAATPADPVFIPEGEKDVDRLVSFDLVATCNPMGAGKWRDHYSEALTGRHVVILADNDETGRKHAQQVAASVAPVAASVKVVELPGLPEHGDVSDWLNHGHTIAELRQIADEAPPWTPPAPSGANSSGHQDGPPAITTEPGEIRPNEAPDDPHRLARIFLREYLSHEDSSALVYHRESFYRWDGQLYRPYRDVSQDLTAAIKTQFDADWERDTTAYKASRTRDEKDKPPRVRKVTTGIVSNTLQALRSETVLSWDESPPTWIDDKADDPSPLSILPARNGLVDLDSLRTRPHTPRFFSPPCLEYDFIPDAPKPERFIRFLKDLWPDDPQSIRELQKWFGYLLTPDTRHQKILLLIGPTRSGKGTLARILERMIGRSNVASPTLGSLAQNFGLWPLVDKTAAFIKDARVTGSSSERAAIVERLLNISGEDEITIDRKYLQPITAKLMARLVVISNEPPNFREASGALANRFAPLRLTNSFLGREDVNLTATLCKELPGILRWFAIEGRKLLANDGRFFVPDSARDLLEDLVGLTSPTKMFAEECCSFLDVDTRTAKELRPIRDLFHAFREWCQETGHEPGSENIFGRNFQAAYPKLTVERPRDEDDPASRPRRYRGVELNEAGRALLDRRLVRNGPQWSATGPQSIGPLRTTRTAGAF